MAKLYYRDAKGKKKLKKRRAWTRSSTYKFGFYLMLLGHIVIWDINNQKYLIKLIEMVQ